MTKKNNGNGQDPWEGAQIPEGHVERSTDFPYFQFWKQEPGGYLMAEKEQGKLVGIARPDYLKEESIKLGESGKNVCWFAKSLSMAYLAHRFCFALKDDSRVMFRKHVPGSYGRLQIMGIFPDIPVPLVLSINGVVSGDGLNLIKAFKNEVIGTAARTIERDFAAYSFWMTLGTSPDQVKVGKVKQQWVYKPVAGWNSDTLKDKDPEKRKAYLRTIYALGPKENPQAVIELAQTLYESAQQWAAAWANLPTSLDETPAATDADEDGENGE